MVQAMQVDGGVAPLARGRGQAGRRRRPLPASTYVRRTARHRHEPRATLARTVIGSGPTGSSAMRVSFGKNCPHPAGPTSAPSRVLRSR
jgi:hypothetical protein